ncbi:MAG TPA: hypothetical protein VG055_20410 [Planctomycetaceae bacterium]|jgi:hypothetical protein|nr:hypothetical protein [Planctomycetaceae bacterium]
MKGEKLLLLRRLFSATVLGTGFGVVWLVVVAVLGTTILQRFFTGEPIVRETIEVCADGTPLIETRRVRAAEGYRDLDGRPPAAVGAPVLIQPVSLLGAEGVEGIEYFFRWGRFNWEWRLKIFEDDQHQSNHWYFVHNGKENGAGYFVGYNWANNRRIGFLGESGFSENPVPVEQWIPVRRDLVIWSQWSAVQLGQQDGQVERQPYQVKSRIPAHLVYFPSGNRVRLVDLAQQTVRTVFEASAPIEGINLANESSTTRVAQRPAILVRTAQGIYGLSHDHRLVWTLPLADDADRRHVALFYAVPDGQAVVIIRRGWEGNIMRDMVYRVSAGGVMEKRQEVETKIGDLKWNQRGDGLLFAWVLPVPVVLPAVEALIMVRADMADGYLDGCRLMLYESWVALIGVSIISLALAATTWWHSTRFALPLRERIAWWFFVALTGLPGFVGYLLHRRWPLREKCPHCQAVTPLENGACAWCEQRFPGPAPKGTEVFA